MIIAAAGRRIDEKDTKTPRFPLAMRDDVQERIVTLLKPTGAREIISSAACGADLIAQDAARKLGIESRIVLPYDPALFLASSVVDRPGDWKDLFEEICNAAAARNSLTILPYSPEDAGAYAAVTIEILNQAEQQRRVSEAVMAVAIWDKLSRGQGDETARFVRMADERKFMVSQISTLPKD